MALSISSNGGNGLANLLRQARPLKLIDGNGAAPAEPTTAVSVRPLGRSGIDSTGSGTAQISAALTVCLSKLGGSDEAPRASTPQVQAPQASGAASRSGAADLLRTLDTYRASNGYGRLSA